MVAVFDLLFGFIYRIINLLNSYTFNIYNIQVSIIDILFGFIVISMVITVFWRGARG